MLGQTFSNLAFFDRIVDMWNATTINSLCSRREWQIFWLLGNLPNISVDICILMLILLFYIHN